MWKGKTIFLGDFPLKNYEQKFFISDLFKKMWMNQQKCKHKEHTITGPCFLNP